MIEWKVDALAVWMNEWMSDLLIDWLAMHPCWLQTCIRFVLMCYSFWTCSTLEGPFCSPSVAPASHPTSRTVHLVKQSTIASRFLYLSFPPLNLLRFSLYWGILRGFISSFSLSASSNSASLPVPFLPNYPYFYTLSLSFFISLSSL